MGSKLASAAFTSETAGGWQEVRFANPVRGEANTTYVASYNTPVGIYGFTYVYFANKCRDNGVLARVAQGRQRRQWGRRSRVQRVPDEGMAVDELLGRRGVQSYPVHWDVTDVPAARYVEHLKRGFRRSLPDEPRIPVRVVEYMVTYRKEGERERIRLVDRWEFELTLDEIETHQCRGAGCLACAHVLDRLWAALHELDVHPSGWTPEQDDSVVADSPQPPLAAATVVPATAEPVTVPIVIEPALDESVVEPVSVAVTVAVADAVLVEPAANSTHSGTVTVAQVVVDAPMPPATGRALAGSALSTYEEFDGVVVPVGEASRRELLDGIERHAGVRIRKSDCTLTYAKQLALRFAAETPDLVVATKLDAGRVFINWGHNDPAKTTIVLSSLCSGDRPIVSTPITRAVR